MQDVARPGAAASAPSAAASAPPAAAPAPAASPPRPRQLRRPRRRPRRPPAPRPIVTLGPIVVVNGRVAYNDSLRQAELQRQPERAERPAGGVLVRAAGARGSAPLLADIELRGRVEGTATLDINGKVNPLATPLALDLQAKVRDLELPPLSPYAIKYAGYGIERGKLSVDLAYVVKPSGQLTASNKIVLNQLAFGDKVEGSTANLPVKLAVALLADQHGVIDLDLPVSGSINDPEFSLGGLIWKVITNLIVKAVTAPFHLLASAFGGGGERAVADRVRARRRRRSTRPRRRTSTRSPRRSSSGRRCRSPSPARAGSTASATPGRRSACAARSRREAPPGDRRRRRCDRRGHGQRRRVPGAAEGGLPARRHRQAEERPRLDQGPAARRDGAAAPRQHDRRRRRDAAARGAARRRRARLPRDARGRGRAGCFSARRRWRATTRTGRRAPT